MQDFLKYPELLENALKDTGLFDQVASLYEKAVSTPSYISH